VPRAERDRLPLTLILSPQAGRGDSPLPCRKGEGQGEGFVRHVYRLCRLMFVTKCRSCLVLPLIWKPRWCQKCPNIGLLLLPLASESHSAHIVPGIEAGASRSTKLTRMLHEPSCNMRPQGRQLGFEPNCRGVPRQRALRCRPLTNGVPTPLVLRCISDQRICTGAICRLSFDGCQQDVQR
jgi:hypothetical protein